MPACPHPCPSGLLASCFLEGPWLPGPGSTFGIRHPRAARTLPCSSARPCPPEERTAESARKGSSGTGALGRDGTLGGVAAASREDRGPACRVCCMLRTLSGGWEPERPCVSGEGVLSARNVSLCACGHGSPAQHSSNIDSAKRSGRLIRASPPAATSASMRDRPASVSKHSRWPSPLGALPRARPPAWPAVAGSGPTGVPGPPAPALHPVPVQSVQLGDAPGLEGLGVSGATGKVTMVHSGGQGLLGVFRVKVGTVCRGPAAAPVCPSGAQLALRPAGGGVCTAVSRRREGLCSALAGSRLSWLCPAR